MSIGNKSIHRKIIDTWKFMNFYIRAQGNTLITPAKSGAGQWSEFREQHVRTESPREAAVKDSRRRHLFSSCQLFREGGKKIFQVAKVRESQTGATFEAI